LSLVSFATLFPVFFLNYYVLDSHGSHLIAQLLVLKDKSPWVYSHINKVFTFAIITSLAFSLLCGCVYHFVDRPRWTHITSTSSNAVIATIAVLNLIPSQLAAFGTFLTSLTISVSHFAECQTIRRRVTEWEGGGDYISSGVYSEDLNVAFLRIVETYKCWTRVIAFMLCQTLILVLRIGVYLAFILALPLLWAPAFAAGTVSPRLIHIYTAITVKSPMLVEQKETQEAAHKASETPITVGDGDRGLGDGGRGLAHVGIHNDLHPNYSAEHEKLMVLCKHPEDIFAIRVSRWIL